jgi:hypothetical protein
LEACDKGDFTMTSFPGSPRLIKGAIVSIDLLVKIPNVIVFQYTPDSVTRRLEARSSGGQEGGDRSEAFRLTGPPKETITLGSIELDATDQLEMGNPAAIASGIYPALSALEMLLYPSSAKVIGNSALAQAGVLEIIPPEAPLTLLVWGPRRVLPVRLTGFNVTEEAFDPLLNPIRAKVDLTLQVLSYHDLKLSNRGYHFFMAHQIAKEVSALANLASGAVEVGFALKL